MKVCLFQPENLVRSFTATQQPDRRYGMTRYRTYEMKERKQPRNLAFVLNICMMDGHMRKMTVREVN